MKILYAIQGTGNGHLSRARDIIPLLQEKGELDILVSGVQADVALPYPIKYKFRGLSFIFGKKGGVDLWATFKNMKTSQLLQEIKSLPVKEYDLIINDFEPVSAWACKLQNVPIIGLSHQSAVVSKNAPKALKKDWLGHLILKHYAPVDINYGFHFERYDDHIFTPVIRKQVRDLVASDEGHYTVYLPSYQDDLLIKHLTRFPNAKWEVFSKHNSEPVRVQNVSIYPINNEDFVNSMAKSKGVLCGAGFETPAEALHLGKKLLVIPMRNQYEQALNAAALFQMGIPVIKSLKRKHYSIISEWIENGKPGDVNYPDITQNILNWIIEEHYFKNDNAENNFYAAIDKLYAGIQRKPAF